MRGFPWGYLIATIAMENSQLADDFPTENWWNLVIYHCEVGSPEGCFCVNLCLFRLFFFTENQLKYVQRLHRIDIYMYRCILLDIWQPCIWKTRFWSMFSLADWALPWKVQPLLREVQYLVASSRAFCAVKADGSVVTWGMDPWLERLGCTHVLSTHDLCCHVPIWIGWWEELILFS
jgi:hypothetical protein